MIAAVLFDLDETLLDRSSSLVAFLGDQHTRFQNRLGDVALENWRDRFLALDARGKTHKSVVYPSLLAEFGGDPDAAAALLEDYQSNCCRHAQAFPGMVDTLQALRSRKKHLGMITNGETAFQTRHIESLGLDKIMDVILISEAEGLRKPAVELFRRAASKLGVAPEQCLFVGDNPTADILGAHAAGMRTAWFHQGKDWPQDIAPMPGAALDKLADVLNLIRDR